MFSDLSILCQKRYQISFLNGNQLNVDKNDFFLVECYQGEISLFNTTSGNKYAISLTIKRLENGTEFLTEPRKHTIS